MLIICGFCLRSVYDILKLQMSYVTYSPNELVYIKGIGYATLLSCGLRRQIQQKVDLPLSKKESIYFDPDLFNLDADTNPHKKNNSSKPEEQKSQKKLVEVIAETVFEKQTSGNVTQKNHEKVEPEVVNIVKARLEGGTGMVYTSEQNVTKSIFLVVKSFLITNKEQIIIQVQIAKTIDALKKQIFTQIGQTISHYHNIKLFTCNPSMAELNVPSKTIAHCHIKENAKLILIADYAFTFRQIAQPKSSKYKVTLTNNTIVSSKIVEQPKKADEKTPIPLPSPPANTPPAVPASNQNKVEQAKAQEKVEVKLQKVQVKEQKKDQVKIEEGKKQGAVESSQLQKTETNPIHAMCTLSFLSGVRYWQIKIQKLPIDEEDLVIGVCIESNTKEPAGYWCCEYAWAYQVIVGKKILVEWDQATNTYEEEVEQYGYNIKQNDAIGVLLHFKGKKAVLTFYKNQVSCGEAFTIELLSLKGQGKGLTPFVNVGGECQITLDPKAGLPIDAYRLK